MAEFGLTLNDQSGVLNINSKFKALALLRKERRVINIQLPANKKTEKIAHSPNEVVVLGLPEQGNVMCYRHFNNEFYAIFDSSMHNKVVEIYYFGFPTDTGKYGLSVYNENQELVFSSAYKYLQPAGVCGYRFIPSLGKQEQSDYVGNTQKKYGIILSCSPIIYQTRSNTLSVYAIRCACNKNRFTLYKDIARTIGTGRIAESHYPYLDYKVWIVDLTGY